MSTHVQTWSGSKTASLTDMTFAGKRGKRCRVVRFSGAPWYRDNSQTEPQRLACEHTDNVMREIETLRGKPFDEARNEVFRLVARAHGEGVPVGYVNCYDEEVKGIDAPREPLNFRVPGQFSASADESGITINDERDQNNLPAMITTRQTAARAYDIARKAWPALVEQARTFSQAGDVLRKAGAQLHYYCRMD